MSNDELEFFQGLSVFLGAVAMWATVAWIRARDRARAAESRHAKLQQAESEAELRRAVEAIAIEVERLGEGQRFLTRVLGESATNLKPSTSLRVITPH